MYSVAIILMQGQKAEAESAPRLDDAGLMVNTEAA